MDAGAAANTGNSNLQSKLGGKKTFKLILEGTDMWAHNRSNTWSNIENVKNRSVPFYSWRINSRQDIQEKTFKMNNFGGSRYIQKTMAWIFNRIS